MKMKIYIMPSKVRRAGGGGWYVEKSDSGYWLVYEKYNGPVSDVTSSHGMAISESAFDAMKEEALRNFVEMRKSIGLEGGDLEQDSETLMNLKFSPSPGVADA